MSQPPKLTESAFDEQVAGYDGTAVVDFFADWCAPCRAIASSIERLAAEHPEIRVARVDIDAAPRIAARYSVQAIPTVVRFDGGEPVATVLGALPYAALLESLGIGTDYSDLTFA